MKEPAKTVGVAKLVPHDLRRTRAQLCHASVGELEQIQFLLGYLWFKRLNATLAEKSAIVYGCGCRDG